MATEDSSVSSFARIEKALETLLPEIDTYGRYRTSGEVARWIEVKRGNPGTIHLTVVPSKDGRNICYPLEGGPAELAGINPGALLLSIDGHPVEGKTLFALGLAFAGPPDSPVLIKVRQPQGKNEEFTVVRTNKPLPNISVSSTPLGVSLRVRGFTEGAAKTIRELLAPHPEPRRLTLDLRGNTGGFRDDAVRVASLFFPEGTTLGKFVTRDGEHPFTDGNGVSIKPASIQILVDSQTASAAEFLTAILKEGLPDTVTIHGTKTYGKGHSTMPCMLEGGGELTETRLTTASGKSWDKTGIIPDSSPDQ
jgi:carboxyl-terminal processing protease